MGERGERAQQEQEEAVSSDVRRRIAEAMDAQRPKQQCISERRGEFPESCGCWVCAENRVINRFVEIVWTA